LDIVLTEAKSSELKAGILQNILQQRSAKEFLAKLKYSEDLIALTPLSSYGIVSDGSNWIFTKLIYDHITRKVFLIKSSSCNILPQLTVENVKKLISRILGMINVQLQTIQFIKNLNDQKSYRVRGSLVEK
jgi:hypothetical protein